MRKHGLQFPLSALQYASIALYAGISLAFYLEIFPLFSDNARIYHSIIFSVLDFIAFSAYLRTTIIDPTDYNTIQLNNAIYCSICKDNKSLSTKHCARCDRCAYGFDHHCK